MLRGLVVALLLTEGVAWADDPLAQARKAVAESDYTAARAQLTVAFGAGDRGPDELVELYRLSGIVAAALGDTKAATDAFTHLLALSPKAVLPPGTSPKIRRPFEAAGRYFTTHSALELKLETGSAPPTITLIAVSDPLDMVAKAHVVFAIDGGAEQARDVVASERTEIALPAARRIDARVAALDVHGNRLVEIGSKEVPIVIIGEAPPPVVVVKPPPVVPPRRTSPGGARSVYLRWWPYAAATVAFGGATAYFAWSARSDARELERLGGDDALHSFSEAKAVEDRGRRATLLTNVGLGVSGAFAVTAAVLWFTAPRDRVESRVSAVPVRGGGAVVFGGEF